MLYEQLNLSTLTLSMYFRYKRCTALYTLLSAVQHWYVQRLFICTRSHFYFSKGKISLTNAVKFCVKISQFKPVVWNSHERFSDGEKTDQVMLDFFYHAQMK